MRRNFAVALYRDAKASRADVVQAIAILEDVTRVNRRIFGANHPVTVEVRTDLDRARMKYEDVRAAP